MMRALFLFCIFLCNAIQANAVSDRVYSIYAVLFRKTETPITDCHPPACHWSSNVEPGIEEYFKTRGIKVNITYRNIERDQSKLPAIIEDIRRTKPDLVFTWGTAVTLGIIGKYNEPNPERFVRDIPVVFTMVAEPIGARILPPNGTRKNVTGVKFIATVEEQFTAMRAYRPFDKIGIIYSPTEENSIVTLNLVRQLGANPKRVGEKFEVVAIPFRRRVDNIVTNDGAADMVRQMKEEGCDWLYLLPDSYLGALTKSIIIPAAMESKLPTFASTELFMETGALVGLLSRYRDIGKYVGFKMEQILLRKIPADQMPVDSLPQFSLQVSMDVAQKLHMRPPIGMLTYAEIVDRKGPTAE